MQFSQIPTKFPVPFANNPAAGNSNPIPQASQIGITDGAASLTDGFPPNCFLQVGAGGVPPWGRDFNGLLNQVSAWARWTAAGNPTQFDSVFSSAVGGYPYGAIIAAASGVTVGSPQGGVHFWISAQDNNAVNPDTTFNSPSWIPVPAVIDGSITYTVGGTAAQFFDLNVAFEYLSRFTISHNSQVILQLLGASSGTAQQFTYTSQIVMDHPSNDRIVIQGATMLGAVPIVEASYALNGSSSGNRAADSVTNLATLRTKFATELHFSGCSGILIRGKVPQIDAVLITGDASANYGIQINAVCSQNPLTNGIAVVGFGSNGVIIDGGAWVLAAPLVVIGCGTSTSVYAPGIRLIQSHLELGASCLIFQCGNTSSVPLPAGIAAELNSSINLFTTSNFFVECNANDGVDLLNGSALQFNAAATAHFYKNGVYGVSAVVDGSFQGTADFGTGGNVNGTGPIKVSDMSFANVGSSTNTTGSSPAVGTVGNNNSLIATS